MLEDFRLKVFLKVAEFGSFTKAAAELGISQPAVSQHLRKLKEAGIITERKVGTWKHYRIHENQTTLIKSILASIDEEWTCICKSDCDCVEG